MGTVQLEIVFPEDEIWKDIEGYEGLYQVSNLGIVKSLNYMHTGKERILKCGKVSNRYLIVKLCKNGLHLFKSIHRLVAQAFIPNPQNLPQINHKDEDKTNNNVENLEWCDARYNANYGTRNEKASKKKSKPVIQLSINGDFIKEWRSCTIAAKELGICRTDITTCCRGRRNKAGGYRWKYAS